MREILSINGGWTFKKTAEVPAAYPQDWESVTLPHTWNALDGQDGGNDYWRGTGSYARMLSFSELPKDKLHWLQIEGANQTAEVYLNGEKLGSHKGGYSTWRLPLPSDLLKDENLLVITVDNSVRNDVYPQFADFTFFGGLYRNVSIVSVTLPHFQLDYFGTPGLRITPKVNKDGSADVNVVSYAVNRKGLKLRYTMRDADGNIVDTITHDWESTQFHIAEPHLWDGVKDPYLYTMTVEILDADGTVLDDVSSAFGIRSFWIDPEEGFFLNGRSYPLRGVSRHQDREGKGYALSREDHEEDMAIIADMGANTIRLAHYQHDQAFYDLCDRYGMVVWAEIPYISSHMDEGIENTVSQMKELIVQNYNHPSIVVWGLSNEITMRPDGEKLLENHHILNDLCHEMDKTRLTTMAVVSMCPTDHPYIEIPDVLSWNHYFGWYGGKKEMNGPWLDKFHAEHPEIPTGLSEYGCEALNWHNSNPDQGDYTEEYQAIYHESLIKQLFSRKYLWATHVWNMFDFAADGRAEGGVNGRNHKGLVTFDRKYRKDSFYAYKAWLSEDPFVHLSGKRYEDHPEDEVTVTVYSNLPEVELFQNGVSVGKKTADDHFFKFTVKNEGESELVAKAGAFEDRGTIRKVDTLPEKYILREKNAVLNWFDITTPEGRFSLNDKVEDIMANPMGRELLMGIFMPIAKSMNMKPEDLGATSGMMQMIGSFTIMRVTSMMTTQGMKVTKEMLLGLNRALNNITK